MAEHVSKQKLSDDQVRRILLAQHGEVGRLAGELGISMGSVIHYRSRQSKRAIRIAKELGLTTRVRRNRRSVGEVRAAYTINGTRG